MNIDRDSASPLIVFAVLVVCMMALPRCHTPVLAPFDPPCENACRILTYYECPEAQKSPKGIECLEVCERSSKYNMQAECVTSNSDNLDAIRKCGVECKR